MEVSRSSELGRAGGGEWKEKGGSYHLSIKDERQQIFNHSQSHIIRGGHHYVLRNDAPLNVSLFNAQTCAPYFWKKLKSRKILRFSLQIGH